MGETDEPRCAPMVWGRGPTVLDVFLEPTCPFCAVAFPKLPVLLEAAGEERLMQFMLIMRDEDAAAVERRDAPFEAMLEVVTHPFEERAEWAEYAGPDPAGGPFVTYCGT